MVHSTALLALVGTASAGSLLWDGRANDYADTSFLDEWSFSNPEGPYQYYIHGEGETSTYVNLDSSYKNPADTGSKQGIQITNDKTSSWNGQSMLRTELIPQTDAAINEGKVFYHFSMKTTETNAPSPDGEHQINFFESHFTEMKFGSEGGSDSNLHWYAGGESQWDAELVADEWHNVAYGIDFSAGTVEFYHSTGADDLEKIAGPVDVTADSNGADWHLGVLRLSNDGSTEDWQFSGVYIEEGDITTSVVSPGGSSESAEPASSGASKASSSSAVSSAASSASTVVRNPTTAASSTETASTPAASSTEAASTAAASSAKAASTTSSSAKAATTSSTGASSASEPEGSCVVEYVYV